MALMLATAAGPTLHSIERSLSKLVELHRGRPTNLGGCE